MSEEKKRNEKKALSEEELEAVAGGGRTAHGRCSACGAPVDIQGVSLPWYGKCPHCGQEAFINP